MPWQQRPRRLISWLDMLQFSAYAFFRAGQMLQSMTAECFLGSIMIPGDQPVFNMMKPLDDHAKQKAVESFGYIGGQFESIGLSIACATARELAEEAKKNDKNYQWLADQVKSVGLLAMKEIKNHAFFYVSPERMQYFSIESRPFIFGEKATRAFPSAFFDIHEAGVCLGLARGTACVFHLMRVLEIGLTVLGKKFGMSVSHTNWAPAIEELEGKIRNMHKDPQWKALPDCKEQQEFYSQAASHLGVTKDAWRNYTMHIRGKFTEDEAEIMFASVRAFMQKLSERLSE